MRHPRARNIKCRRPRKSENEESTPIARLRSSKGRRPPLDRSRPIEQVPTDGLDLGIVVFGAYEGGTVHV